MSKIGLVQFHLKVLLLQGAETVLKPAVGVGQGRLLIANS